MNRLERMFDQETITKNMLAWERKEGIAEGAAEERGLLRTKAIVLLQAGRLTLSDVSELYNFDDSDMAIIKAALS